MKPSDHRAFSLVEVTLALGIATFALLSALALLPVGLQSLRASIDNTMEGRVLQRTAADLEMTPFSEIRSGEWFFDSDGEPLSGDTNAYYRVAYTPYASDTNRSVFPGISDDARQNIVLGVVSIYRAGENMPKIGSFPITVANSGL